MGKLKRMTGLLPFLAIALLMVIYPLFPFFNSSPENIGVGFVVTYEDGSVKTYEGTDHISLNIFDYLLGANRLNWFSPANFIPLTAVQVEVYRGIPIYYEDELQMYSPLNIGGLYPTIGEARARIDTYLAQQIVDPTTGKIISDVYCTVKVTPTWVGSWSSNTVTGTITVKNNHYGSSELTFYTGSPTNPVLSSGIQTIVWSKHISNAELKSWSMQATGSYYLTIYATITVKVTFTDGTSSSQTSSGTGKISYALSG